jgi:hypothetical protein
MKRVLTLGFLGLLVACSDSPTESYPPTESWLAAPDANLATVIGTEATWYFGGVVVSTQGTGAEVGDPVTGNVTFTITSGDLEPDVDCWAERNAQTTFTFTVAGEERTATAGGSAESVTSAWPCSGGPLIRLRGMPGEDNGLEREQLSIELYNPADTEDFPLVPPPISEEPHVFSWNAETGLDFAVDLTYIGTEPPPDPPDPPDPQDPQDKQDCMDGGWEAFGFRNQGQCIRYVVTGKDGR